MTSWSEEEKDILRNEYPHKSAKELSDKLSRGEAAIHSKASRMGINKQESKKRVSKCEDCGEEYEHGGELSWGHTTSCRACWDRSRRFERKNKIVNEVFDGECGKCGYSKCLKSLTLHHRNPEEKEIRLSNMTRHSWDKIINEVSKCDLLCANCHNELHCSNCVVVAE